ncbi:hypothetical protein MVEN_00426900 [Mycena venus]|uniref:Small secreted protein n=1 Tax=Mycena venus TaxID=2733690 RepID=A0A8H6YUL4_9AGAR|nr:hypothetical protein MVEN_00426900 [Mycena venus]
MQLLATLLCALAPTFTFAFIAPAGLPQNLTLTALVGKNGLSSLECWALTPALVESTATGTVGGPVLPGPGGQLEIAAIRSSRNLPTPGCITHPLPSTSRYVIILTGRGELSFPSADPSDSTLSGNYTLSAGDILIAADTAATSIRGHNTVWQAGSSVLQMPFAGSGPSHIVLHDGGCLQPHM